MAVEEELASDLATAATALAGLLLVFLGAVIAGFESYEKQQQASVATKFQRRAWLALAGFFASLGSAIAALAGKWFGIPCLVSTAGIFLALAFVLVAILSIVAVASIK